MHVRITSKIQVCTWHLCGTFSVPWYALWVENIAEASIILP